VLTAAAPPPSPARSIEGRLVQGGPGLPASLDRCGEPPAAALRLPATRNINETNNGRNIGSSPFTGEIADLPSNRRWFAASLIQVCRPSREKIVRIIPDKHR